MVIRIFYLLLRLAALAKHWGVGHLSRLERLWFEFMLLFELALQILAFLRMFLLAFLELNLGAPGLDY